MAVLYGDQQQRNSIDGENGDPDQQRLHGAIKAAGEDGMVSLGVVEVYRYHDEQGGLQLLDLWMCQETQSSVSSIADGQQTMTPTQNPVLPGASLVGTIWTSITRSKQKGYVTEKIDAVDRTNATPKPNDSTRSIEEPLKNDEEAATDSSNLFWRDLASVQSDPDTWKCSRLPVQIQLQLERAAGVTFDTDGVKGLVVFYSRTDTDKEALKSALTTVYLTRCTNHIGSIVAMTEVRHACMAYKAVSSKSTTQQSQQVGHSPTGMNDEETAKASANQSSAGDPAPHTIKASKLTTRVVAWYNKCWGGGLQIPPAMEPQQVAWTLAGSFCGMLVLSLLNELFVHLTDEEYFLVIGPFGAQMTLLYALHSAPASQPRNVVLGEVIAGAVSLVVSYVPMPRWLRRAVGPALEISAMTAAGVTHPPAGAHATIWADDEHNWYFYAIVILGSAISVIPATLINNMSVKRQYPLYWGYVPKWLYRRAWKED